MVEKKIAQLDKLEFNYTLVKNKGPPIQRKLQSWVRCPISRTTFVSKLAYVIWQKNLQKVGIARKTGIENNYGENDIYTHLRRLTLFAEASNQ